MNIRVTVIFLLVIIAAIGAYYWVGQSSSKQATSPSPPSVDQFTTPDRPTISASPDTTPQPVGEGLAPSTALVRATVLGITKEQQTVTSLSIRVDEVLSYGSSTPPLPVDTELSFDMSYSLDQKPEFGEALAKGASLQLKVGSQQGMAPAGGGDVKPWAFIEFVTNQ